MAFRALAARAAALGVTCATASWAQPTSTSSGVSMSDPPPSAALAPAPAPSVPPPPDDVPRTAVNALFLEVGGPGLLYSLNYDGMLAEWLSLRVGVGSYGPDLTFVPMMVNVLVGSPSHKLELGLGADVMLAARDSLFANQGTALLGVGSVSYRYAPRRGGFFFRAGFDGIASSHAFVPWGGVSFGRLF